MSRWLGNILACIGLLGTLAIPVLLYHFDFQDNSLSCIKSNGLLTLVLSPGFFISGTGALWIVLFDETGRTLKFVFLHFIAGMLGYVICGIIGYIGTLLPLPYRLNLTVLPLIVMALITLSGCIIALLFSKRLITRILEVEHS